MKFGLRNTRRLLEYVGNPHRSFPSVHVAGTNGKGSTASFLASVFTEAGYRTALYTSPHLVRFTERIRINGAEIPEQRLVEYVRLLRPAIEETRSTFFEATTCVAFLYFADEEVDVAVLETGLGGRLDATNVVVPEVSVITSVGFDHMDYLGNTIRSIAREKGGIIKHGIPAVTSSRDKVVLEVLAGIARRRRTRLTRAWTRARVSASRPGRVRTAAFGEIRMRPGLGGHHQAANAQLAVAALDLLMTRTGTAAKFSRLTGRTIERGLSRVVRNVGLQGRLQWMDGRICLDVAHNPDGVRTLVQALGSRRRSRRIAVFGAMKDKDWHSMLRELGAAVDRFILVAARTPRAIPVKELLREARRLGFEAVGATSVRAGVRMARRGQGRRGEILVTGSHYVVGEFLEGSDSASA